MLKSVGAKVVAGLVAVAAVVGGTQWWRSHHGRGVAGAAGSGAPLVGLDPKAPFKLDACSSRIVEASPALALTFTQPIDARQKLDELLRVTDLGPLSGAKEQRVESAVTKGTKPPAGAASAGERAPEGLIVTGAWTVADNPRTIYFPYMQPERRFRIELRDGLKSVDGAALKDVKPCEVASDTMAPSYFFASRGVVLPAAQNGGLPVVTVNVPEVDIQFLRIEPSAMPRFLESVAAARKPAVAPAEGAEEGEGDFGYERWGENRALQGVVQQWELDKLHDSTTPVHLGRYVTDDQSNRRKVSFIPVEQIPALQAPGVYVAVMAQPGRFRSDYQATYFYVSDIGLHARRYSRGLDAFATSLKSGEALGDVEFELLDIDARSLGKAKGDGDGHAHFDAVPDKATLLLARRGREISTIVLSEPGLDLSEFDIGGHPAGNVKLFAYAGRDLYRPGENFEVSVLARDADGKPLAPTPVTATLKRPDGRTVQTSTWRPDEKRSGYLQRGLVLPADAQTGRWHLELRADPAAAVPDTDWSFQVEEFLPERMKLELKTDKPALGPSDSFDVQVQGDYLFGSPAAGNRLVVSAATERAREALPQAWPGFVFGDFADDEKKKREDVSDDSLDDRGAARVTLPTPDGQVRSPMLVRGSFSLLESGGRPVVRSIERIVWPADTLIAVRPLFDGDVARESSSARFEVVRVNVEGKTVPLAQAAPVRLIREDRQYYWRFDDQKGWHSGYIETDQPAGSTTVALKGDRAPLTMDVGYGRYRLEIDDPETGQKLRYRFYAGWDAQDAESIGNRPDRVALKLEGAPYKAGDTAKLVITPPHDGQALVTVEGDGLLWSRRVGVKAAGTTLDIPVGKDWTRHDLYVGVAAFRPGSAGDRVTPARAVGLAYLPLARADRQLQVAITAPAKVLPEKRSLVKVKAQNLAGQTGTVTLSAVDVGILNITRYATPDPFDFFFGKHRYAPELDDLYGKLIEKMDGTPAQLKFGGDSRMRDTKSLPKKVKLVDLFSGPVTLDANGEAQIPLDLPDFNGTLRLMAVVSTADRYGRADAEMTVAAPVVAELATPRFISPGDAATIALDVTNLSGAAQELSVKLEGADPVAIADGERKLTLADQQRQTLRFAASATDAYGLGRLRLKLASASGLAITRESVLQVQPTVPMERDVKRLRLEPGAKQAIEAGWIERYFKGSAAVSVSVSNKPPINVRKVVQGLLDYPYGCLEQTTSAAYPHLYIDEAGAKTYGLTPRSREERATFLDGAIGRLAGMQKANGGFTLWGDGPYETWISAYVIGFLQDARSQGFTVPDAMLRRGQDWLLTQLQQAPNRFPTLPASAKPDAAGGIGARDWELYRDSHQRFAELAHIGYVLSREQKAPLALLRLLHDRYRDRARSPLPLVHLALALKAMGDANRAQVALDDAMQRPYGLVPKEYRYYWYSEWLGDYGTPVRDLALSYALLVREGVAHPRREQLLFDLADRMGGRGYWSTQERLALYLAARAAGGDAKQSWTVLLHQGDVTETLASKGTEQRSLDAAALARGAGLENGGSEALFVELEASGYPVKPPAARPDFVDVRREWFELDGSRWSGRPLKVGDMLIVKVEARAKMPIEQGLIVDRIPAGFEVENLNLSQGPKAEEFSVGGINVAQAMNDGRVRHREYRDDRYVAAAQLGPDPVSVFYLVRVVSPGRYAVPAPYAEDMYRPELRGSGTGPIVPGTVAGASPMIAISDPRAKR